jgi:hypothetical protein
MALSFCGGCGAAAFFFAAQSVAPLISAIAFSKALTIFTLTSGGRSD